MRNLASREKAEGKGERPAQREKAGWRRQKGRCPGDGRMEKVKLPAPPEKAEETR